MAKKRKTKKGTTKRAGKLAGGTAARKRSNTPRRR